MQNRFSCYVIGDGSLTIQCCDVLLKRGHLILGVVSTNVGLAKWCKDHDICLFGPHDDYLSVAQSHSFEYLFSVVNMRLLSKELVQLPSRGAINFHDGPLPKYAGVHATSWALMNREKSHGVTWHLIGECVDAGEILEQHVFDIPAEATAFDLNTQCFEAGIATFAKLVKKLELNRLDPQTQEISQRSYYGMWQRPESGCALSWHKSAEELAAFVRSLSFGPVPNPLGIAKVLLADEFYLCPEVRVVSAPVNAKPGAIVDASPDNLQIATAEGAIEISGLLTPDGTPVTVAEVMAKHGLSVNCRLDPLDDELATRLTENWTNLCQHEAFWVGRLQNLLPAAVPYFQASRNNSFTRGQVDGKLPDQVSSVVGKLSHVEGECCDVCSHTSTRSNGESARGETIGDPGRYNGVEFDPASNNHAAEFLTIAFAAFLARLGEEPEFDLGIHDVQMVKDGQFRDRLFSRLTPFRVDVDLAASFEDQYTKLEAALRSVRQHRTYARDIVTRYPELSHLAGTHISELLAVQVEVVEKLGDESSDDEFSLRLVVEATGQRWRMAHNRAVLTDSHARRMADQFSTWLTSIMTRAGDRVADLDLLDDRERQTVLKSWNDTNVEFPRELTIHRAFEEQVSATPDSIAVVCDKEQITYRKLNERANQLGNHLQQLGVGADTLVGVYLDRSIDMVVGLLGILKSGGAYVPLDPAFPAERIALMLEDSESSIVVTQDRLLPSLPEHSATVVCIDSDWSEIGKAAATNVDREVNSDHLAYVIYTSGSTGKPKGVMVEHHNVVNFFVGMDQKIEIGQDPVFLAVTSLSFDISVLEIFWTLTRGFKVVMFTRGDFDPNPANALAHASANKPLDFSIFYFSADQGEDPGNKYRLLREGARFADENGFVAVWTPERHFHDFGGLYPNPAVTGAALAEITERVQIRSGSVVTPLHSPIRIAEEWSVVDNLSGGRVGISFASGWMPEDFVIKPESLANRKSVMFETIEKVRQLWRGEAVAFPHPVPDKEEDVLVRTLPRPVQDDLPVWVTTAGNPETYEWAAKIGANVLTHLLGQSIEEVAQKVARYRELWKEHGHPGRGHVSLMLHTFVSDDAESVKETVRHPLTEYLRTSAGLIKKYSWAFPTFKRQGLSVDEVNFDALSDEEMDAVLEHAFDRYYETSGLFGTPESCTAIINKLKSNDIDEIACLIDFGVKTDLVLDNLKHLNTLRAATSTPADDRPENANDQSIPALIKEHGVTHFQCTPSMATMLLVDETATESLGRLKTWLIGGEAFPESLASRISSFMEGNVLNMYGPTEATIWSTTHQLDGSQGMSIGRPIANTQLYIVDKNLQPVPVGVTGELMIGGQGVVRGYRGRPQLTSERFIKDPFRKDPHARLYRTGDFVRYRPDGNLEFTGRMDHQVKIRGYRIELGEVETRLGNHPSVSKCVVTAWEDSPGDKRLVAYVIPEGKKPDPMELRQYIKKRLPEYMVPSNVVFMDSFPQTPNNKIDRKALPPPGLDSGRPEREYEEPETEVEQTMAELWKDALGVERVGRSDDFFDLGGHSLSAVQIAFNIGKAFHISLPLRVFMEDPVLSVLAQRVEDLVLESADSSELEVLLEQMENTPGESMPETEKESPSLTSE